MGAERFGQESVEFMFVCNARDEQRVSVSLCRV